MSYNKNIIVFLLLVCGCSTPQKETLPEAYFDELESWKQNRDVRLRSDNSFVNLAGLYWLADGENTFGSDSLKNIVFPEHAPGSMGTITLQDSIVYLLASEGIEISVDSLIQPEAMIYNASEEVQSVMHLGRYKWYIIERAGNYGIRLRDLEHPQVLQPLNIQYYDWSDDWMITAHFQPYDSARSIQIDNIVGFTFDEEVNGELVFEMNGQQHSILPLMDDDGMFIMFADATSGDETYGAGRYLVAELPDEEGNVLLDFNKAYNPPCAFTDFATCPLPPQDNILEIPVLAGEKAWH